MAVPMSAISERWETWHVTAPPNVRVLRTLTQNALRRNPATTVILAVFVALSAMLASSAGALAVTVSGASESLMQQARTPHFLQMHAGTVDEQRMSDFAAENALVEDYAVVPILNIDGAAIRVTGDDTDTTLAAGLQDNSFVTQNRSFDLLLDTDGQVIDPAPGTVWLPLFYQLQLGLQVGQTLTVTGPASPQVFSIAGFLRDSQMNSSYASSKRLLVGPEDLATLTTAVGEAGNIEHLIQFRLTGPDAVAAFEIDYRAAGLEANGPTVTWSLFALVNSLSEGILAAIVGLVTLLLVGIALLCVRFTLLTTIERDYREIGVLKAIGVRGRDLRRMYSGRYLMIAVAGAAAGFIASWGLNLVLLRNVQLLMGSSGRTIPALLVGAAVSALIVAIVVAAVRRTLRRLDGVSAVQALRTGHALASGRRRPRPAQVLSAVGDRPGINVRLGLRDVLGRSGLYVVPLVIYTLAAFILIVPQNLHTTVAAPNFITYMGAGVSDMRVDAQQTAGRERVSELSRELADDPRVRIHTVLATASYMARDADGAPTTVKIESGDLAAFPLTYMAGKAPKTSSQIALSQLQAETLAAGIGDQLAVTPVLAITDDDGPLELTVSGIYQDVTNGGRTAKMVAPHTSADLMWSTIYADFDPGENVPAAISAYAAANPDLKVSSVRDYIDATIGSTIDALRTASIAAFVIGLLVATLITGLFMRMLITKDAFSIAVMKALGFRDGHIQAQYVMRSVLVLAIGVGLGAVLANTVGSFLAGMMLSTIGLSQLQLIANPWLGYIASPVALLLAVALTTLISTRPGSRYSLSATLKD